MGKLEEAEAVVVIHFDENGEQSYYVFGDKIRLFTVDERVPNDRVYEWLSRSRPYMLRQLIPDDSEIGNQNDERHEAIKHRVLAADEGRKHLSVVESNDD
jgi:hypothetical protein